MFSLTLLRWYTSCFECVRGRNLSVLLADLHQPFTDFPSVVSERVLLCIWKALELFFFILDALENIFRCSGFHFPLLLSLCNICGRQGSHFTLSLVLLLQESGTLSCACWKIYPFPKQHHLIASLRRARFEPGFAQFRVRMQKLCPKQVCCQVCQYKARRPPPS